MSSANMRIHGWIFDAYPVREGISLWILDAKGQMHTLLDAWQPRLYAKDGARLNDFLSRNRTSIRTQLATRKDIFTRTDITV